MPRDVQRHLDLITRKKRVDEADFDELVRLADGMADMLEVVVWAKDHGNELSAVEWELLNQRLREYRPKKSTEGKSDA